MVDTTNLTLTPDAHPATTARLAARLQLASNRIVSGVNVFSGTALSMTASGEQALTSAQHTALDNAATVLESVADILAASYNTTAAIFEGTDQPAAASEPQISEDDVPGDAILD